MLATTFRRIPAEGITASALHALLGGNVGTTAVMNRLVRMENLGIVFRVKSGRGYLWKRIN
jgi:hypothetical protein